MPLPKQDAAFLSTTWTEGVLLKRDVFSTVERGRFRTVSGEVGAVLATGSGQAGGFRRLRHDAVAVVLVVAVV